LVLDHRDDRAHVWLGLIYNSDEYLRSGDFLHSVIGHGPLVVIAESGDLHALGGARPIDVTLPEFAKSRHPQK